MGRLVEGVVVDEYRLDRMSGMGLRRVLDGFLLDNSIIRNEKTHLTLARISLSVGGWLRGCQLKHIGVTTLTGCFKEGAAT